ncbi:hypothetical protein [Oleiagrimonas sp. C23AA]|uniref:hypothetical protein n=1 Tax=Oleiagrimonas sp. C23AA TaxID=2719047 RepID=UPI001423B08C|nr:hypothetical protein [Oleiagrimonas sp. C23AA]NII09544.1 hypothetical protein [Oleiagrimonas sp. C23AA]
MKSQVIRSALLALLATATAHAHAGKPVAHASMVLDGQLVMSPQGTVKSYTLDHAAQVPMAVRKLIAKNVQTWRFSPVVHQGHAVTAKVEMHLRVVATPNKDRQFQLRLADQWFGDGTVANSGLRAVRHPEPMYPQAAVHAHLQGSVMVVAQVQADGHVSRIAAEQVNLQAHGPARMMKQWRQLLASAATSTLAHWTFQVPNHADEANNAHWLVRIPVNFTLPDSISRPNPPTYGQWLSYAPGPRVTPQWLTASTRVDTKSATVPTLSIASLGPVQAQTQRGVALVYSGWIRPGNANTQ